jgi:ATP-binding protein involved in chromosome partitioning
MSTLTTERVLNALKVVIDPDLNRNIVELDFVNAERVRIEGDVVYATVVLTTPACPVKEQLQQQCVAQIEALEGVARAEVTMSANTATARPSQDQKEKRLSSVRNVIAVGSGKGGVGKSTVATNIAYALAQTGARVGILDADIYGPSLPILLGLRGETPALNDNQKITPLEKHGLKVISMGFLLKDTDAVVWRGPMLGKALQQFIEDVDWGELDYLVIDLPPGTGDVQLSLAQLLELDGALLVTTPQDVAFADVRRALRMFQMMKVPLLGIIENMSYFLCPDNQKRYYIFGEGRTAKHAEEASIPFLGQLPLEPALGPAADRGELLAVSDPNSEQSQRFSEIAGKVASELSKRHMANEQKDNLKGFFKIRSN